MRRFLVKIVFAGLILLDGCSGLDSVDPDNRTTWIYFYGGIANHQGIAAEPLDDGYLIIADSISSTNYGILVIKTDKLGNEIWRKNIPRASASAVKVTRNGYYIIGDRINVNLAARNVNDQLKRAARIIKMDPHSNAAILNDIVYGDTAVGAFRGNALTVQGDSVVAVISEKIGDEKIRARVAYLNASDLTLQKSDVSPLDNRDFLSTKSVHVSLDNDVVWGSSAALQTVNSTQSYVFIADLSSNTFVNGGPYGATNENHIAYDCQPSGTSFGIVGTYATKAGDNGNIFFIRTSGNRKTDLSLDKQYLKYFDGADLANNNAPTTDPTSSTSIDEGTALASVSDGGFLVGGSTTTTQTKKDIILIRLDPSGNLLWHKTFGGIGDETISTIRQAPDGGFLICGTLDLAGLKSVFVMKTNSKGELKD